MAGKRQNAGPLPKRNTRPAEQDELSSYFRLRDFEYVQPLYDLAFFLEIDALSKGTEVPKYRTFSLWRAGYSLDGYGTSIDRWLDGDAIDADLDYVPSNRIKQYLIAVRQTGTIPELKPFRGQRFDRCLSLRSVRGLGPNKIALTVSSEIDGDDWFDQIAINVALDRDRLTEVYRRDDTGPWQSAHIVPPMFRLLHRLEEVVGHSLCWNIGGMGSPLEPVVERPSVTVSLDFTALGAALKKALRKEKLFKAPEGDAERQFHIRHQMRWGFSLGASEGQKGQALHELIQRIDPFAANGMRTICSDLHLHTAWSDGSASVSTMAQAVADSGLSHFAVTDHSRTSKLQSGLTPPLWLRQANALSLAAPVCPVFHGIEVDILRDGELDLPHTLLQAADLVVASVHSNWTDNIQTNTARVVRAVQSGFVDILAHPTAALTGKPGVPDYLRPPAEVDWECIFRECSRWRVAVEFNCFPSRLDLPLSLLRRAVDLGCAISLGSDAHARSHLSNIRFGEAVLKEVSAPVVLNRFGTDDLRRWIAESRAARRLQAKQVTDTVQPSLFDEESSAKRPTLTATIVPPHHVPGRSRVVGIDLTAGDKPTGIALLDGLTVETCSLSSDDEILGYILKQRPQIVSIDSPLGLPGGGQSVDPKAGIVRVAEHDLASIGIPAYPALIDSMRELTLRGMRLRRALERSVNAPKVIESYPGAAQDILCIPRKQKSLDLLREGLRRLGLTGAGLETKSHDEMDAVTSAVVGRYFEVGRFEPMGIVSEAQLIVPKVAPLRFDPPPVICLAGKTGAGKSVVARYLSVFYGFEWIRTRDLIKLLLEEDLKRPVAEQLAQGAIHSGTISEIDLRTFGAIILNDHKQIPLQRKLRQIVNGCNLPLVVDSIRDVVDLEPNTVVNRPVLIWFVDCNDSVIRHRLASKSKFGTARLKDASPVDHTVPVMRRAAHRAVNNNGTLEELRWRVDDTLFADMTIS